MKVILLRDVSKVGKKYDVRDVADGYARNFLLARGFAKLATAGAIAEIEKMQKGTEGRKEIQIALLEKALGDLEGRSISISKPANEKGHLFSHIHPQEIVEVLKEKTGISLPEDAIILKEPVKTLGAHTIEIAVQDHHTTITLTIEKGV